MSEDIASVKVTNVRFWSIFVGFLLAGAGGGLGGSIAWNKIDPPRPDPFTGTEGQELERRITALERKLDAHLEYSRMAVETILREQNETRLRIQNDLRAHERDYHR